MITNKLVLEEINRFKSISKYKGRIIEQEQPVEDVPPVDAPPVEDVPPVEDTPVDSPPIEDAPPAETPAMIDEPLDNTEEIDITDLVNMTKSIKRDLENNNSNQLDMEPIFSKLNDLEVQIQQMDSIVGKIDQLYSKIDEIKPKTPEERLEMRSLDSYPFNINPNEFFTEKQKEMKETGKNEYILRKSEIDSYTPSNIKNSFSEPNVTDY
jgi:hypothetical protein